MSENSLLIGETCEEQAANFLKKRGYKILQRNFRTKFGELDIVAKEKDTVVFLEVKGRSNFSRGLPQEAINNFKRRKIAKCALLFLKKNNLTDSKARFDVVSINTNVGEVKLFKNAFELDRQYLY